MRNFTTKDKKTMNNQYKHRCGYIPETKLDSTLLRALFLSCCFTEGLAEVNFGGGGGGRVALGGGGGIRLDVGETNFFGAGIDDTFLALKSSGLSTSEP